MMFIPSLVKIFQLFQKLLLGQAHRHGDTMRLFIFPYEIRKVGFKAVLIFCYSKFQNK